MNRWRTSTHLEPSTHNGIIVDHVANRIDELDYQLGHVIARRRLPTNHDGTWHHLQVWICLDPVVLCDHVEAVQQLAFVLMDALYL